jgi:hypothetical protein
VIYWNATIEVENVSGTRVTIRYSEYYMNGTLSYMEIINGDVALGRLLPYLIVANLTGGDQVFSGSSARINWTTAIQLAGHNWDANYLAMPNDVYSGWIEEYWDQETGLLLVGNYFNNFCCTWRNWTLTSATLANIHPSGVDASIVPFVLAGSVSIAMVLVLGLGVLNRKKA